MSDRDIEKYARRLERTVGPLVEKVLMPTEFEHKVLTDEEKQALVQAHIESCRKLNDEGIKKRKVQRDKTGAVVERFSLHIDTTKSMYTAPDAIPTGVVKNIVQAHVEKKGPQQGHWSKGEWFKGQHNYNRQRNPFDPEEAVLGTRLMNTNPEVVCEGTPMRKCKMCRATYPDKKKARCPGCGAKNNFVRFLKHDDTIREGDGIFMKQLGMHVKRYRHLDAEEKAVLSAANHLKDGTAKFLSANNRVSDVSTGKIGQGESETSENASMRPSESGQSSALASGGLAL